MIYKKDSSELMEIFDKANNKLEKAQDSIITTGDAIKKRLVLLNSEYEYLMQAMMEIKSKTEAGNISNKIIFSGTETYGLFDSYGLSIHPRFAKAPQNIFNFMASTGPIFKNNMTVKVNGVEDSDYTNMLMHDSIDNKDYAIKEYDSDILTIEIAVKQGNTLGDLLLNVLEIQPFLIGSFNIESFDIYEAGMTTPTHGLDNIKNVSPCRIILDEKATLSKIVFNIKLLYKNSAGKYLFGLKHLYFLNADFEKENYIIAKIEKNKTIDYIYEDVVIHSQYGQNNSTTAKMLGIEFYLSYENGTLSRQIETSTEINPNYISANSKYIYMKVPVSISFMAITPDIRLAE